MSARLFTRASLAAGVAVPILYFGTQLMAMRFYPNYEVMRQVASELGTARSTFPAFFNTGAILTGVASLLSAPGFVAALGRGRVLAWLVGLGMISAGLGSIIAGSYPLPDPRHNPGAYGAGTFALPLLFLLAMWRHRDARGLKIYLIVDVLLFLCVMPILAGETSIPLASSRGGLQRIGAFVVYVPAGVVAAFLLGRSKTAE